MDKDDEEKMDVEADDSVSGAGIVHYMCDRFRWWNVRNVLLHILTPVICWKGAVSRPSFILFARGVLEVVVNKIGQ